MGERGGGAKEDGGGRWGRQALGANPINERASGMTPSRSLSDVPVPPFPPFAGGKHAQIWLNSRARKEQTFLIYKYRNARSGAETLMTCASRARVASLGRGGDFHGGWAGWGLGKAHAVTGINPFICT